MTAVDASESMLSIARKRPATEAVRFERADLFENEVIVISHASIRYRPDELRAICAQRLPDGLRDRVIPMVSGPPWVRDQTSVM